MASLPADPAPQETIRPESKAAFLYNISRFIDWQDAKSSAGDSPVIFAVMEDDSLGPVLKRMLEDEGLNGRVLVIHSEEQIRAAREFFNVFSVSSQSPAARASILKNLRGSKVLTVSEAKNFIQQGGMVQVEGGRNVLRYKVGEDALVSGGLKAKPALKVMADKPLTVSGKEPKQVYAAWKKVFDEAQTRGEGLPVPSDIEGDLSVYGRMKAGLKWIGIFAALFVLIVGWSKFRGRRSHRGSHG